MSDKATAAKETKDAFGDLHKAIDGLTEEEAGRVWLGVWGVREILIHISGWHTEMATALGRVARGEKPYADGTYDDYDAWNARFVADRAGVKLADVIAELDTSHRALVAAAEPLPEAQFAKDGTGAGILGGVGAAHYKEHTQQIREWRAQIGR
jgi:hypothetical protein